MEIDAQQMLAYERSLIHQKKAFTLNRLEQTKKDEALQTKTDQFLKAQSLILENIC